MGQAQLLLIVLGVVLVGIAIVAGIQAYSTNNVKASIDAQVHDMMRIASDAQTWVQKPPQFGGPATYASFEEIATFAVLNYKDSDGGTPTADWTNVNATYSITSNTPDAFTVTSTNSELNTFTALAVCGINDSDIFVETNVGSPPDPAPSCE